MLGMAGTGTSRAARTQAKPAANLGVSERLGRREFSARRLAGYKPCRGVFRFHREDVDARVAADRIEATRPMPAQQVVQMAPIRARRRSGRRQSA